MTQYATSKGLEKTLKELRDDQVTEFARLVNGERSSF